MSHRRKTYHINLCWSNPYGYVNLMPTVISITEHPVHSSIRTRDWKMPKWGWARRGGNFILDAAQIIEIICFSAECVESFVYILYQTTGTKSFTLNVWKLHILGRKNLWGVHSPPPPHPPNPWTFEGLEHFKNIWEWNPQNNYKHSASAIDVLVKTECVS